MPMAFMSRLLGFGLNYVLSRAAGKVIGITPTLLEQTSAKPIQDRQSMKHTITSDVVEAYSICPRKAFLMMTGVATPGAHKHIRITEEQAAANRQAHRTSLGQVVDFPPGEIAGWNTGAKVL